MTCHADNSRISVSGSQPRSESLLAGIAKAWSPDRLDESNDSACAENCASNQQTSRVKARLHDFMDHLPAEESSHAIHPGPAFT